MIATSPSFPLMWSYLVDITYPYDNVKVFNFTIMVMEIMDNSQVNEADIWNDSVMILEDFIKFLQWNSSTYYRVEFGGQLQISPFTERFTEYCAGASLQIKIEVDFDGMNNCGIAGIEFPFTLPTINYTSDEPTEDNLPLEGNYISGGNDIVFDEEQLSGIFNYLSAGFDIVE
jgi:hypothetical protein